MRPGVATVAGVAIGWSTNFPKTSHELPYVIGLGSEGGGSSIRKNFLPPSLPLKTG